MYASPVSNPPRRLLPAALATLVIGTGGVLVILTMVPPAAMPPSAALDREASGARAGNGATATPPAGRRLPFTSPAAPAAARDGEPAAAEEPALAGRVVDGESRPIPGALVKLARTGTSGPRNATTRTDGSGEFVFRNLTAGTWRVAASAAGYRPRTVSVTVPDAERLELVLEEDRGLEVSVTDPEGAPVPGARVALRVRSLSLPGRRSGSTTAEGTVTLGGILVTGPDWTGQLTVRHGDYLPLERVITPEDLERGELGVVLERGGELRLRIVSADGEPVSGALVTVFLDGADGDDGKNGDETRRLRSVSTGEAHFRSLRPGDYTVTAATNRDGEAVARGIAVAAGDSSRTHEIALERGEGSLTIRVSALDGSALPLCAVRLAPSRPTGASDPRGIARDGITEETGACRFEGLPAGTYDVEVGGQRFTLERRAAVPADGREVVLSVDRPGSISGRIELPHVQGGYAIRVSGSRTAGDASAPFERTVRFSAFRRSFTLRYVPSGTYTLDLLVDGRTAATIADVEVRPGETTEGVTFRENGG